MNKRSWIGLPALLVASAASAQNSPDPGFDASVANPAFAEREGPVVVFDEGHRNFHSSTGRYKPTADVLRSDGYRVGTHDGAFTAASLDSADVLLIASPLADIDLTRLDSYTPPLPSAFTQEEISAVADWVRGGGGLMLVVDYQPLPGMAADLAAAFGVHLADGYAYDGDGENHLSFTREAGTLRAHPVTDGRRGDERVDAFHTFAGSALLVPHGAEPLLMFGDGAYVVVPERISPPDTPPPAEAPRHSIAGWSQGAVLEVGEGRVAVIGETAALSAQRFPNGGVTGMNYPPARENKQFLLNLVRWLAHVY